MVYEPDNMPELYREAGLVWPRPPHDESVTVHEPGLTVDRLIAHLEGVRRVYGGGVVVVVPRRSADEDTFMAADRSMVADGISLLLWGS